MSLELIISSITILFVLINLLIINKQGSDINQLVNKFDSFQNDGDRLEKTIREEVAINRREINETLKQNRSELTSAIERQNYILQSQSEQSRKTIEEKLTSFQGEYNNQSQQLRKIVDEKMTVVQNDARLGRSEQAESLKNFSELLTTQLNQLT
jgi:DNA recombination protein RmuC